MELGLSEDQQAIREVFAAFFTKQSPIEVARAAEPAGFDAALWQRLLETGAPGMAAPESAGGGGAGLSELIVAAEQFGRSIAPLPFVEHAVAARAHPADDLVSGETIATLALAPARDGVWSLVPAGSVAEVVLGLDGDEFVAVRSAAPGVSPRNFADSPLADRSTAGERTVLGGRAEFDRAVAEWKTVTAAALLGIARASLDLALVYVNERYQFGVPIGSFQAVQHQLADASIAIEGASLLVGKAAWAGDRAEPGVVDVDDNDITEFGALASMAYLYLYETASLATDKALHVHGGYGYAEEYDIQLFYRRARGWSLVLGDPAREARRLADQLFGPVTQGAH
jgi:alkylation response protein AidB-like acyl-CoA dehydrogenase